MYKIYIARQAIYNKKLDIYGYELLARNDDRTNVNHLPDDIATARVLSEVFNQFGLDNIIDGHQAIIKLSKRSLMESVVEGVPKSRVLFEINEGFLDDDEAIKDIRRLKSEGGRFIYSNYTINSEAEKLLPYCDVIKVDVKNTEPLILDHIVKMLEPYKAKVLADKVEDYAILERCKEAGFHLYQGYFLCEPKILKSHGMETTKTNLLQLLKQLNSPDISVNELEQIISRDVSLSYKLLRYLESASIMAKQKVSSIRSAIIYLGLDVIRNWASIIAMSNMTDKPAELVSVSLIRAKMCQLMAEKFKSDDPNSFFLAGLFSTLDALLDMPMEQIIRSMPVVDEVKAALMDRDGEIGQILQMIIHYERGEFDILRDEHVTGSDTSQAYLQSLQWAEHFNRAIIASV